MLILPEEPLETVPLDTLRFEYTDDCDASATQRQRAVWFLRTLALTRNVPECIEKRAVQEYSAAINTCGPSGYSLVHTAAYHDSHILFVVCSEITRGVLGIPRASLDTPSEHQDRRRPLHCAAANNSARALYTLLRSGAAIDARDACGNTPLHYAAMYSAIECARILLAMGADPTARNERGRSPNATRDERFWHTVRRVRYDGAVYSGVRG